MELTATKVQQMMEKVLPREKQFKKLRTICNKYELYLHWYSDNTHKITILDSQFNLYGIVTVIDDTLSSLLQLNLDEMFDMYNLKKLVSTREEVVSFFKCLFPKDVVCDMIVIDMDIIKNRYEYNTTYKIDIQLF